MNLIFLALAGLYLMQRNSAAANGASSASSSTGIITPSLPTHTVPIVQTISIPPPAAPPIFIPPPANVIGNTMLATPTHTPPQQYQFQSGALPFTPPVTVRPVAVSGIFGLQ